MKLNHKQMMALGALALFIAGMILAFVFAGEPIVAFISDPTRLRAWVAERGTLAPVLYGLLVALQVIVAIIPGEPFEIAAGYAFGAWLGTAVCVVGTTLGAALVFLFVRRWGIKMVQLFFPIEKVRSLKFLRDRKKLNITTFILFLIPGTPKDILTYAVGLTDMKLGTWLLITSVARIPSIVTSTIGGNALGTSEYGFAAIVFGVTLLISGIGILIYRKYSQ